MEKKFVEQGLKNLLNLIFDSKPLKVLACACQREAYMDLDISRKSLDICLENTSRKSLERFHSIIIKSQMPQIIVTNESFLSFNTLSQDSCLDQPVGLAIIDDCLWVTNNGGLTHYTPQSGQKLFPRLITVLISVELPPIRQWIECVDNNIRHLPINESNILLGLGLSVDDFILFQNFTRDLRNGQIKMIPPILSENLKDIFTDYRDSAPCFQTLNDISTFIQLIKQQTFSCQANCVLSIPPSSQFYSPADPIYLLSCTRSGIVFSYLPTSEGNINYSGTQIVIDCSQEGSIFTGMTLVKHDSADYLYVVDWGLGTIRVFASDYREISDQFPFLKEDASFIPYNMTYIYPYLYVIYVPRKDREVVKGPGTGLINLFRPDGTFVQRWITQGSLNVPWNIVVAPSNFQNFANQILIGNQGDGLIQVYNLQGEHLGPLKNRFNVPFYFSGLQGIVTDSSSLYVSAFFKDQFGLMNSQISRIDFKELPIAEE